MEQLFADDCALLGHTEEGLHEVVNRFGEAVTAFGLIVIINKSEVLHKNLPNVAYNLLQILIN